MATAAEILAQATGDSSADKVFVIDNDLRTIKIPSGVTNLGVESDDEVMKVSFDMPSTYGDVDLSTFKVRINYLNAKAEGDMYEVDDLQKVDDRLTFTWVIGRHAAMYKGNVKFVVCLKEVDDEGNVSREFNTTIATLPVLEGLETGEQVISEYADVLEQWKAHLFGTGDTAEQEIIDLANEQKAAIKAKGDEVIEDVSNRLSTAEQRGDEIVADVNNRLDSVETRGDEIVADVNNRLDSVETRGDEIVADVNSRLDTAQTYGDDIVGDVSSKLDAASNRANMIAQDAHYEIENLQRDLDDAQDTVDALKQSIADKGNETLASIPEEYTELNNIAESAYNTANELRATRANAIVNTVEGTTIRVDDASNDPIRGLKLYGKTEQVRTSGSQLMDLTNISTDSGGTTVVEVLDNGKTINVTGTKSYAMALVDIDISMLVGTTLYLNGSLTGGNSPSYTMRKIASDGTKTYIRADTMMNEGYVVEDGMVTLEIQFVANNTATTLDTAVTASFTDAIISKTKSAGWEPFTGGKPSPSPDYPQEMVSCEDPVAYIYGKNLLEPKNNSNGGYTATLNEDGSVTVTGAATTTSPIYLTFATPTVNDPLILHKGQSYYMWGESSNGMYIGTKTINDNGDAVYSTTNNWNRYNGTDYMNIAQIYVESSGHEIGDTKLCGTYRFQLEVGDSFTGFEAYKDYQHVGCDSDGYSLAAVPVASGGNYTDPNGQQWVCDEIDLERGVYITRIGNLAFEGHEDWVIGEQQPQDGYHGVFFVAVNDMLANSTAICNRYMQGNSVGLIGKEGQFDTYYKQFRVNIGAFTTVDGWKSQLRTWASEYKPLNLQYILETPIEEPLPPHLTDYLKEARGNYKTTTVLGDSYENTGYCDRHIPINVAFTYNADTKTYIDKAIDKWLTEYFANQANQEEVSS